LRQGKHYFKEDGTKGRKIREIIGFLTKQVKGSCSLFREARSMKSLHNSSLGLADVIKITIEKLVSSEAIRVKTSKKKENNGWFLRL
jgi:hypothetical protein